MIALQSALFAELGGFAGLSALIGSRVYPDIAPQDVARPYVTWSEISFVGTPAIDVGTRETSGLNNYRIQITSWAVKAGTVRDVDAQVRLAMQAATRFKSLIVDARSLDYEPDTKLFGFATDFSVWLKT